METATRQGLEALLFLADDPMSVPVLAEALELEEPEVESALIDLAAAYERDERGMVIRRAAGGWRMYTAEAAYPVVERHVLSGKSGRLTQAALETLAVVAYKQPISRQEISDIRGVNADGAVRSLVARGFVEEVGRDEGPGQAVLYGTTTTFLERIGIDELADLPPLTSFLPEETAPDEPLLGHLKEARRHLRSGADLPATGRGRWSPSDPATNMGADPDADEEGSDDEPALPPMEARGSRREQDAEMEQLTSALERAARSAMSQLREAVQATEEDDEQDGGGDEDDRGDAGQATGEGATATEEGHE